MYYKYPRQLEENAQFQKKMNTMIELKQLWKEYRNISALIKEQPNMQRYRKRDEIKYAISFLGKKLSKQKRVFPTLLTRKYP